MTDLSDLEKRIRALAPEIAELVARSIADDGEHPEVAFRRHEGTPIARPRTSATTVLAPTNVRYTRYDATQGELFWERSDSERVTSYRVTRDGAQIHDADTTSKYMNDLTAGAGYTFTVRAVDEDGNLSDAVTVEGDGGGSSTGGGGGGNASIGIVSPTPGTTLTGGTLDITLKNGGVAGRRFDLFVFRAAQAPGPVYDTGILANYTASTDLTPQLTGIPTDGGDYVLRAIWDRDDGTFSTDDVSEIFAEDRYEDVPFTAHTVVSSGGGTNLPDYGTLAIAPGVQGYGVDAPGGRGKSVVVVTNRNSSGSGSLKWAMEQSDVNVVFDVSGWIDQTSEIRVGTRVSVYGQSAPGRGVGVRLGGSGGVNLIQLGGAQDVLLQHLRCYPGSKGPHARIDGVRVDDGGGRNIVVDHCSFGWGRDQVASAWDDNRDVTFSWCTFGESLPTTDGYTGRGLLVGDRVRRFAMHHCLLGGLEQRNPSIKNAEAALINNVVAGWVNRPMDLRCADSSDASPDDTAFDVVGNTFKEGPGSNRGTWGDIEIRQRSSSGTMRLYMSDNGPDSGSQRYKVDDRGIVSNPYDNPPGWLSMENSSVVPAHGITIQGREAARDAVYGGAGATPNRRDSHVASLVSRAQAGTLTKRSGGVSSGDYAELGGGGSRLDRSRPDTVPASWLDPRGIPRSTDCRTETDSTGFTYLQLYQDWLGVQG